MKIKFGKYIILIGICIFIFLLAGCGTLDKLQKKLSFKNEHFEYLNSDNVEKITVQSIRDKGFKFIVTENSAINDMYTLLSKAKVSDNKSELEPDYIFEIDLGDEKKQFNYIVGSDGGNFYNDELVFSVSNRLEEGIIQNLSFIRTPRDFDYIYYDTILEVLEIVSKKEGIKDLKVGINIQGDVDCLKYIYSIDLQKFIEKAKKILPNVELVNSESEYGLVLTVKNRGYDSTNFKTKITSNNKIDKITDEYYVVGVNQYKEWSIEVSEANNIPSDW